jgi:CheY-like chemotaxis protein
MTAAPAPPKHILAGDDSPDVLALLREILEGEGYRVSVSPDPLDLSAVKQVRPDLVILDHMLEDGEGSGWQLMRQLREDPQTGDLPIVVCTGAVHRVRQHRDLLDRLGVGVVVKPFDIDHLLAAVRRPWADPVPTAPAVEALEGISD